MTKPLWVARTFESYDVEKFLPWFNTLSPQQQSLAKVNEYWYTDGHGGYLVVDVLYPVESK